MEKLKSQSFLCVVSSFIFFKMKNIKKQKKTCLLSYIEKVNQTKKIHNSKREGLESAVWVVGTLAF